jgi:pimeloyl-ACP methyl ester carboxylesterase
VLCLHGFPDTPRTFEHQLRALAGAGYRVAVPFMRGYGPTAIPRDGVYQTAMLGRDVLGLIDALGAQRAIVVGHDWGALAAYAAALKSPDRVERLVALAVPYGPAFVGALTTSYEQLKRSWYIFFFQQPMAATAVAHDDYRLIRRLWADWSPGWRAPEEQLRAVCDTLARPGVLEAALGYYRCAFDPALQVPGLAEEEAAQHMAPITVPTLYLHGRADGCMGVELAEGMESMFPAGLTAVIVEGAGHFLHQERPAEVNAAILRFLAAG